MSSGSFRDIRLFVAAYEERSFTAAARRENATQSGVSQHMRKLEDSLGVSLFVRNKGRVVATPAGDSYYRHCIELLNAHAKATAAVRRHGAGLQGDIVIGLMPTMTRCALAPVLARFIDEPSQCGRARGRGLQRRADRAGAGGPARVRRRARLLRRARA